MMAKIFFFFFFHSESNVVLCFETVNPIPPPLPFFSLGLKKIEHSSNEIAN